MQNTTGEIFNDSYLRLRTFPERTPQRIHTTLVQNTKAVADRLSARRKGYAAKRYNGPVLLEGDAAAELFARHFANQLSAHPHSTADAGAGNSALASLLTGPTASLLNKVGSRVLPDFLTVIDNPQLTQTDGHTLFGNYKFDEEGTPAQETTLIKNGVLKTLLTSRTPVRGMLVSTGNMRERGVLPGNLFVDASKSSSREDLRKQLLELVKTRNLEYGMILRRLANNAALEAIVSTPTATKKPCAMPASRKSLPPASKTSSLSQRTAPSTQNALRSPRWSASHLLTCRPRNVYRSRPALRRNMTVEHVPNDTPKLPIVPSPLASNE